MATRYYDAHNHLQDERLQPHLRHLAQSLPQLGLVKAVVAGSGEEDWESVAALAEQYPWVIPSFGVHPWYVKEQSTDWEAKLRSYLQRYPQAGIGEAGLDRWIADPDVPLQVQVLRRQFTLAVEYLRPVTLHCLRAFGLLAEELQAAPRLPSGFLLHSYGGPVEMVPQFAKLGAYFSVSPYFLHTRKAQQWTTFRTVPLDRLLVETDAPDMWPPDKVNPLPLKDETGKAMNHPANIQLMYQALAKLRGITPDALEQQVEQNFLRLWGV